MNRLLRALPGLLVLLAIGCQGTYYDALGTFGVEKRGILRDLIGKWRQDQHAARTQFTLTQESFGNASGAELADVYKQLDKQVGKSESAAKTVSGRTETIEKVGADVFEEWGADIAQIQNTKLRKSSEATLGQTRTEFDDLLEAMKDAESEMGPILTEFTDRLVFFKTNMTTASLDELHDSADEIRGDLGVMDRSFEHALEQADQFVGSLPQ